MSEKTCPDRLPVRKTALALIAELGSESNAHGVARIVRSRDSRRKVLWSLMVLFGVGAAVSQLSSLLHKYLQYQVVEVSEIQDGLPVEFPSVTLCNIEPISWRKLRQLLNGTSVNSSDVRGWLDFLETFDFGAQQSHLRSIRAFHENVGREARYVRHSLNESLLHCSFNKQPCSTDNFTTSFDGNYYSCFTFNSQLASGHSRPLIVHSTGPEHGLSVVMFLDNNFPPLGTYGVYTLDTSILHSAGARVMVHAPNTLPIPVQHGQDVAPGFSTSVSIKPLLHARLPQPYGNCSDSHLRGLSSFTSTFSTCIAVCKQEVIVHSCGCRSSALPEVPSLSHVPYCGHVANWRHMLQNPQAYNHTQRLPKLRCEARQMERMKNDRGYETSCGCTHPCWELSYHMSTSMSYWPTELYQYDALKQLYGEAGVLASPLNRAYRLHDSNIKDGEEQMLHISQQGQPWSGEVTTPWADLADPGGGGHAGHSSPSPDDEGLTPSNDSQEGQPAAPQWNATVTDTEDGSQNSSGWGPDPAPTNSHDQQQQQQKPLLEYNSQQLDNLREASTDIRQNLLRLNVYLEDLSVVKYKQMPAYGLEDLFADIGGTLGLWMGVSVLTMVEALELIVRLSNLFFAAQWRPGAAAPEKDEHAVSACSEREREFQDRYRSQFDEPSWAAEDHKEEPPGHDSESEGDVCRSDKPPSLYSYRSVADFPRSEGLHAPHGLFDLKGPGSRSPHAEHVSSSEAPPARPGYSGRTKYWRLKRGKSKR